MGFQRRWLVFNGDYGFSMVIMGFIGDWVFNGNFCFFIGNYRFLMAIMGLMLFLCIHVHLIHFFTIDPLGSKLTCYLLFLGFPTF